MGKIGVTTIPKYRNQKDLKRGRPKRQPYDSVLIVCEGAKTEPNYFQEIRVLERLSSAHVKIIPSTLGTDPLNVVKSAIEEFEKTRSFDKIYVVFDRDDHLNYDNAIVKAEATDKKLKNNEKKAVTFEAIVSVPSFEFWLLLHFADVQAWFHRDEIMQRLKQHIANYEKGMNNTFASTRPHLEVAKQRGSHLKEQNSRRPGNEAYTDVQDLVTALFKLRTGQ
ncbi:MAG: RloB family protein [Candidatus Obscuribacterales bacterium]|jgi:hypothetical protein|nr:RloB family protein [Candidatus Obscuribacterales bacterium]